MSKRIKDLESKELASRYGEQDSACVVSVSGMDAISANRLRGVLREQSIDLHVVRNRLARRTLGDGPLAPLVKSLEGPCAFVTAETSVIDVAKELVRLAGEHPKLELKQGIIDGDASLVSVEDLAKMKSRIELIGEVVLLALSPARRIAGCLTGPGGRVAGSIKTLAERSGEGTEAEAA